MKIKQIGRHQSLVQRLRKPVGTDSPIDKLDAIGEALAYLIDKKHAKRKLKKLRKGR